MDSLRDDERGMLRIRGLRNKHEFSNCTAYDQPIWLIQCNDFTDCDQHDWQTYLAAGALSDLFKKIQTDRFLGDPVKEKVLELELALKTA